MKLTKEQIDAIVEELAEARAGGMEAIKSQIGDAFNQDYLANAIVRAETESLIDNRVQAAQRYARLIPVNTSISGDVDTAIVKGFEDAVGIGRPHSGTGSDIPLAEVTYGEQVIKLKNGSIGYQYSVPELQSASSRGTGLSSSKPAAARLAYERHIYKVAMLGEPETGNKGLLNHDIPEVITASASWDSGDVDAIMNDLSEAIGVAYDESTLSGDTSLLPNTILLPAKRLRMLNNLRISSTSDVTLLQFMKRNNILAENGVDVSFEALPELNTAGADGGERIVIYNKDPSALELLLPKDLEFLAPQAKGLDIFVPAWYTYGGVWLKSPKAVTYLDGIGG